MTIEKTSSEILIRLPIGIELQKLETIIMYLKCLEILLKSQGTEMQAVELARQINKDWWLTNKHKYLA